MFTTERPRKRWLRNIKDTLGLKEMDVCLSGEIRSAAKLRTRLARRLPLPELDCASLRAAA